MIEAGGGGYGNTQPSLAVSSYQAVRVSFSYTLCLRNSLLQEASAFWKIVGLSPVARIDTALIPRQVSRLLKRLICEQYQEENSMFDDALSALLGAGEHPEQRGLRLRHLSACRCVPQHAY